MWPRTIDKTLLNWALAAGTRIIVRSIGGGWAESRAFVGPIKRSQVSGHARLGRSSPRININFPVGRASILYRSRLSIENHSPFRWPGLVWSLRRASVPVADNCRFLCFLKNIRLARCKWFTASNELRRIIKVVIRGSCGIGWDQSETSVRRNKKKRWFLKDTTFKLNISIDQLRFFFCFAKLARRFCLFQKTRSEMSRTDNERLIKVSRRLSTTRNTAFRFWIYTNIFLTFIWLWLLLHEARLYYYDRIIRASLAPSRCGPGRASFSVTLHPPPTVPRCGGAPRPLGGGGGSDWKMDKQFSPVLWILCELDPFSLLAAPAQRRPE